MKEKQFDPAGINKESPAPGMAAVDTQNSEETKVPDETHGAELHITESTADGSDGEVDGINSVDPDVTPRNLEADSDGA